MMQCPRPLLAFQLCPWLPAKGPDTRFGSMSLIKGLCAILSQAGQFYYWALTAEMDKKAKESSVSFQLLLHKETPCCSQLLPDLSTIKLIHYYFKNFGSSEERECLLQKWQTTQISTLSCTSSR